MQLNIHVHHSKLIFHIHFILTDVLCIGTSWYYAIVTPGRISYQ